MQVSIDFDHNGKTISAVAIYDFNQIGDAIIVKPQRHIKDLGESIFFKFENDWYSDSHIKSNFPNTYSDMLENLVEKLKKEQLLMEVYTQNLLS